MKNLIYAFLVLVIVVYLLAGCATQRTLCEDLDPLDCQKMERQMNPEPMRPVFDPPIRPEPWGNR